MKRSEAMCLNNKIKEGMKNSKRNIERLDSVGLSEMLKELKNEELSLITFSALADIYAVYYRFMITITTDSMTRIRTITSEDDCIIWFEIDKLYKEYTGEILNSASMNFRELTEAFAKINGVVSFE